MGKISLILIIGLIFGVGLVIFLPQISKISNRTIFLEKSQNPSSQCRFWGMVASSLSTEIVLEHLIRAPDSLKNLGARHRNGWGVAYYLQSQPVVLRGELPADQDENFISAVEKLATSQSSIGVAHIRLATSGAIDIPNPHPFIRFQNGKFWAFGHNGTLSKEKLKKLIGEEYLKNHQPIIGESWDDPNVIDSDLYLLYLLKSLEENHHDVLKGIAQAVREISKVDSGALNFFLTDGETLWGFRKGNTLYYSYQKKLPRYTVIASQPPNNSQKNWVALADYNLIVLTVDQPPLVIQDIREIGKVLPVNQEKLELFTLTNRQSLSLHSENLIISQEKSELFITNNQPLPVNLENSELTNEIKKKKNFLFQIGFLIIAFIVFVLILILRRQISKK